MTEIRTYHGQPVLKQPVWTWEIPCYFFTGGLAGASAGLAFLSGLRGNEVLARRSWATAFGAATVSPLLLTSDLGRPARFMNMFRMLKPTSPMSVGSWVLLASGSTTALGACGPLTGRLERSSRAARPLAALLGLPLATYTGALVANTAVPVWHEARQLLPGLFGAGAALSAGAFGVITTPPAHAAPARRLALAAAVLELGAKQAMEWRLGDLGESYHRGESHKFGRVAQGAVAAGATLLAARGRSSRAAATIAGTLMAAGALAARWSVFMAGFDSAADPAHVVGPQRRAVERGERKGAARKQARVAHARPVQGTPATAPAVRRSLSEA